MQRGPQHPGEITADTVAAVQCVLQRAAEDDDGVASWFGRYISTPRLPLPEPREPELAAHELMRCLDVGTRCTPLRAQCISRIRHMLVVRCMSGRRVAELRGAHAGGRLGSQQRVEPHVSHRYE